MRKAIGCILIGIGILNIVGFAYMLIVNSSKFENNTEHFIKRIVFALGLGSLGIYLIQSGKEKPSAEINTNDSKLEK